MNYSQYILKIDDKTQQFLNNQQFSCYICSQPFIINDSNHEQLIIKTLCNHFYHYDCLKMSILNSKNFSYPRECPYCRSNTGWLPLTLDKPIKKVHKEYYNSCLSQPIICKAILKSGKKKGQICGCKGNPQYTNKCCGRHKNYKFPENNIDKEYTKNNWFKGKILKCYV